jgi:hypothetical protein
LGIGFGFTTVSVHKVTKWIVSALVPAFVAPNVLKWHWWRFNGWGFFAGMCAGTAASLVIPWLIPDLRDVYLFLLVLAISFLASYVVCLLTPAENERVLKEFYVNIRPWGWWEPIFEKCRAENPGLEKNRAFWRDWFNLGVGLVWQTSMVALPIYLVIQQYSKMLLCLTILTVTSIILKFTWYDRLGPGEMYLSSQR